MKAKRQNIITSIMLISVITMLIITIVTINSKENLIDDNRSLSRSVDALSKALEEKDEILSIKSSEVEVYKYKYNDLKIIKDELEKINNTLTISFIEMMTDQVIPVQVAYNPQLILRKMELLDFENTMLMKVDTRLLVAPTLTSPYILELKEGDKITIYDKVEVRYLGKTSIWYEVEVHQTPNSVLELVKESINVKGWLPIEAAQAYDGDLDNKTSYIITKAKVQAYHTKNEVYDLSHPVYIYKEKNGYILREEAGLLLIITSDGNEYWIKPHDVKYLD